MIVALQALLLVETWLSRFKFASHYTLVINGASECKMDVESTWISTLHQNGPCFNIALTISKNHLWESSLTQHWETMALRYFTTNEISIFSLVQGPCMNRSDWNSVWLRVRPHMTSQLHMRARGHTTWFWKCLGTTCGHFFLGSHNFMVTALGSCVKRP